MRHIQYQGEAFPLVLVFHLVLGKFHIQDIPEKDEDIHQVKIRDNIEDLWRCII